MDKLLPTTRWTLIDRIVRESGVKKLAALAEFYLLYVPGLAVIPRCEHDRLLQYYDDEELAHEFLIGFLFKSSLERANPKKKFRSYLRRSYLNFRYGLWRKVELYHQGRVEPGEDVEIAEPKKRELRDQALQDRNYAVALYTAAFECNLRDLKPEKFELAQAAKEHFWPDLGEQRPTKDIAEELGKSESWVKVGIHNIRQDLLGWLREIVGAVIKPEEDVDEEVNYILILVRIKPEEWGE